ncbi:MAG: hypothetical protein EXS63_08740 [Candidatus Omnitrophica bacterium]|nr:hypothetical protein [Candidatus Omnitrophota bacterium]
MMKQALSETTDLLRQKIVEAARAHKASWIQLGQYLFTVHNDKLFKTWGFLSFEAYCIKDLSIKQTMAAKLLKSYAFLEKEEPRLAALASDTSEETAKEIPHYESVNLLRLAKENKFFTPKDFSELRECVLEDAKEPKEVKAQVKRILEERKPEDGADERQTKRQSKIKRLIVLLRAGVRDLEEDDLLPEYLSKQVGALIQKLEDQIV